MKKNLITKIFMGEETKPTSSFSDELIKQLRLSVTYNALRVNTDKFYSEAKAWRVRILKFERDCFIVKNDWKNRSIFVDFELCYLPVREWD